MNQLYDISVHQTSLKASIEGLTPMGVRFVSRIIDPLSSPLQAEASDTWLGHIPGWIEYFGLTISVHHGTTAEPLGLVGFEVAFRNACEAVGWTVDEPGSATQRFVDMTVHTDEGEERKLSLKSTAAQRLSETTAHISKLTEAAWIQDVRSAKTRRDHTLDLFRQYRSAVDAIIMLRAFRPDRTAVPTKYQLLEIPTDIFASLEDAPLDAFAADGPTINCTYHGDPAAARVSLVVCRGFSAVDCDGSGVPRKAHRRSHTSSVRQGGATPRGASMPSRTRANKPTTHH